MRLLPLLILALLLSACSFPAWRDQVYRDLLEGRLKLDYSKVGASGSPSQTVDLYDAGGGRIGYGVIRGGAVDFYNVDGSRAGTGRIGR